MRKRASLLVMALSIALIAVACGRASEKEINQALGITPTPTQSPQEVATGTARAAAQATQRAEAAASGSPAVALGNPTQGQNLFRFQCMGCHRAEDSDRGPALTKPNSPGLGMTPDQFRAFLRGEPAPDGTVHSRKAYTTGELSDKTIGDIYAYLQAEAGK
jgi:cytochrome c2